jgi:two-component system, OmpR family, alkaline phosphatase synthesis response regulator PhoP
MDRHAAPATPAARGADGADGERGAGPADVARPAATVLVVEDEPAVAGVEALILADAGLAVTVAPDGGAALAALGHTRPALVVLDLDLPVASGFRVLEVLKGDPATARVPVLVVTALDFAEARAAARAGADAFLTKPFDAAELAARAARLLAGAGPADA